MSKLLKILSTILLFVFSFYYTNKGIELLTKKDPLMQEIINKQDSYKKNSINAIITNNTIIPGNSGIIVDIKESYKKMKKLGYFNDSLLVYQKIKPLKSYLNNFDKIIISGNTFQNNISIIFYIDDLNQIYKINAILKNNDVIGNIFLNDNNLISKVINNKYSNIINILSNNYHKNIDYCITESLNINNNCLNNKKYTILSSKSINKFHLTNTKSIIKNGSFIVYSFNDNNLSDLNIIIKYIKNNHYNLVSIDSILKE